MSPARLNIRFNIGGGGFIDTHDWRTPMATGRLMQKSKSTSTLTAPSFKAQLTRCALALTKTGRS